MKTSRFGVIALLTFLALLSTIPAYAQSVGNISGTVTDESGAGVPGATVTAKNEGTGAVREMVTDGSGRYVLALLPIGSYSISAAMSGFRTEERSKVVLEVQQSLTLDFGLKISSVTSEVTVTMEVAPVSLQRNDASLGQLINAQQVAELPLNGRNFVQLALLGPGTVSGRAGSFLAQGPSSEVSYRGSMSVSAQGMRENANDWLYDGVDDNELTAGGVGILPNIDSIREFKVLTHNYNAQYGSRGGTTVLVSSKSGENSYHGSLFEFFRNDALDARNFFDGAQKRPWNQNTYGFSTGGPIRKDKTFFFGGFQGNNIDEGLTTLLTVPTALMHQGIFTESFPGAARVPIYDPSSTACRPRNWRPRARSVRQLHHPVEPYRSDRQEDPGPAADADLHRSARGQLPGEPGQDAGRLPGGHPRRSQHQQQRPVVRPLQHGERPSVPADRPPRFRCDRRVLEQPDVQDQREKHRVVADPHLHRQHHQPVHRRLQPRLQLHHLVRLPVEQVG